MSLPDSNVTCSLLTGLLSPRRRSCLWRASNRTTVSRQVNASPEDKEQGELPQFIQYYCAVFSIPSSTPTVGLSSDASLCVCRQALTQPHLLPGGIGDRVSKPSVSDLMDHIDQQELAALQDGCDDEGEAGVLHGNDGERRGQEHDVTPETGEPN